MAKINELSDNQLEKAFLQYTEVNAKSPSDKVKHILQQLQLERRKRQSAQKLSQPDESELTNLSKSVEAAVTKKKNEKKKKADKKFKNRIPSKGAAPAIDTKKGNAILLSGLISGGLGLILCADDFMLLWLPDFPLKMAVYSLLIVYGLAAAKISAYLSDDNR
jgi:hypothetical protein